MRPDPKSQNAVLAVMLFGALVILPARGFAQAGFRNAGDLTFPRSSHAATVLGDGSVLVASDFTAERYDPVANAFTSFTFLTTNRGQGLTATLLTDGRVLLVGGQAFDSSVSSAEVYDPVTGTFSPTGSMATPRSFHTATRLPDGRVLVIGGHQFNATNSALDTAEVYDPAAGAFLPVGSMSVAREAHTATSLSDGRVLVAGGYGTDSIGLTTAEIFDPASATFTLTGSLTSARGDHSATSLTNGKVLIVGGHAQVPGTSLDSAELYDPAAGLFMSTGSMTVARGAHTATMLPDGTVLVAGGFTEFPFGGVTLDSVEIYDPGAGSFAVTASMPNARGRFIAAPLASGDVLVAGGLGVCCSPTNLAEVFTMTLVDTEPPVIFAPDDMSVVAQSPDGAFVHFNATVTDDIDANPELVCSPQSGSLFPIGTTSIVCTATDQSSNVSTAGFNVTVFEALTITSSLDNSGTVNPSTGIATVSGTVSCTRSTQFLTLSGDLSQVISNRATLNGSFFSSTTCVEGTPLRWSATVAASNGRYKAGKATATLSAFACDDFGSCSGASTVGDVQLRSKK